MEKVKVIGAGLAGCEAAWQLATRGIPVELYEMKPQKTTPAHHSADFAELVCSNSLRSDQLENAVGLLKEELRRMNSLIMACADAHRVPAGGALAVDRYGFSSAVTQHIRSHPNITVIEGEVTQIPEEGQVIIASGPLTSDALSQDIARLFPGSEYLHFFDAAAPIVTFESIDMSKAWFASRYDRGTPDYINCPMTQEEYDRFWTELTQAKEAQLHEFDDGSVFEGCMPVEVMARRGRDTLCYGPLKPVGLPDPRTGKEPFAVVQLRKDNAEGSIFNIVGFQTHLTFPEQKRAGTGGVCPLWGHAPEHLPPLPGPAEPLLPGHRQPPAQLCRPDDRRGGLCGVHRLGTGGGGGAGPPDPGTASGGLPSGDRPGGPGPLYQRYHRGEFPAHERQLRHHSPPGLQGQGQAE